MKRVLIIGDLAWDIKAYLNERVILGKNLLVKEIVMSPGGVAGNMAWYIKELGHAGEVAGAVGNDVLGELMIKELNKSGIGTDLVKVLRGRTGILIVIVDSTGERTMIGERGANKRFSISKEEIIKAKPSWIHLSGYTLLNRSGGRLLSEAMAAAQDLGMPFSIDLEGVSERNRTLRLKGAYAFCNEGLCSESLREGANATIIKAGQRGCYLEMLGTIRHFEATRARAIELTGAGDAFNAAFISAMLNGHKEAEACRLANEVAGYKASKKGTRVRIPERLSSLFLKPFGKAR